MAVFTPPVSPVDADRLRLAMGQFATGVTIITTRDRSGQAFGTTANAVSSVSLKPPLVLACLRQESETLAALLERRRFAINVLHSSQLTLSDRFARRAGPETWDAVAHRSVEGIPLLEGAIATLECELHDLADGGDHAVVVGHVVSLEHAEPEADPLLFYAGSYRRIGEAPAAEAVAPPGPSEHTEVALPAREGPLRMLSLSEDRDHTSVAVIVGEPRGRRGVLVYPHVPCLLGDALGSTACGSRARLTSAQARMRAEDCGVTVYHRDTGAGLVGCGCAGGGETTSPSLSDDAIAALARGVRVLNLRAVRLVASVSDARRAARAGVPVGDRVDPSDLDSPGQE
jgi:3-hydroxy-9,10-secoandrosta-1,3,5(10)-triene-9,17-dione monooxygenase reductase component